jgi:hypothetical protein
MSLYGHTNAYFGGVSRRQGAADPLMLLGHRCRLIKDEGEIWNFPNIDHIHVWISPLTAFVFIIKNDKPLTITEDANVFPSDELVAKFFLMMEK